MMIHRQLVVGAAVLLVMASCGSDDPSSTSGESAATAPVSSDSGPQTSVPVSPAATAPEATAPEATTPEATTPEATTPVSTPERLATMADGMVTLTGDSPSGIVSAIDPTGRLVVAYWALNDGGLKVVRCVDTGCAEPPDIFTLDSSDEYELEIFDMVLRPDGSPIVIARNPATASPAVYVCSDATCANVTSLDFDADAGVDWLDIALAPDGLPRIAYFHLPSNALKLAVCGDLACSADQRTTVTIDDDLAGHGEEALQIDPNGRILIGYESMSPGVTQARVAVCDDDMCSSGPTILTIDDASGARTTPGTDDHFWVWYRAGSELLPEGEIDTSQVLALFDLMVASCDITGCGDATEVEVGWGMLMLWPRDVRLVSLPDHRVVAATSYWSPELCAQPLELMILDPVTAQVSPITAYRVWGPMFDAVGTVNGVVVVSIPGGAGIQVIELGISDLPAAELSASCG
jgi:hypothetical protein